MGDKKSPQRKFYAFLDLQYVMNHRELKEEDKRLWFWLSGHYIHAPNAPQGFTYEQLAKKLDEPSEIISDSIWRLYHYGLVQIGFPFF